MSTCNTEWRLNTVEWQYLQVKKQTSNQQSGLIIAKMSV